MFNPIGPARAEDANVLPLGSSSTVFRTAGLFDFLRIDRMVDGLYPRSAQFFNSRLWGFKRLNVRWLLFKLVLMASRWPSLKLLVALVRPDALTECVVAEDNRRHLVGFAYASGPSGGTKWLGICIKDEFQGKGIGKHLIGELIRRLRGNDTPWLNLMVDVENSKAIQMYLGVGFSIASSVVLPK